MKIAVFGASGGIGKHVVEHALNKGYKVKAYVRNPKKLHLQNEKLFIYVGEVDNYAQISSCIQGCDAVINALGISMKFSTEDTSSITAHENIFRAMQEHHITRLIDWATPSIPFSRDTKSFLTIAPAFLAGILYPKTKKVLLKVAHMVQSSSLDWTIVRFITLKNSPFTGKVKVGFGDVKMNYKISRSDVAYFMVEQVESKEFIKSMPLIGS